MRIFPGLTLVTSLVAGACLCAPVAAQDPVQSDIPCRDRPCAVSVDWTRAGGVAGQIPDRRYGNPTRLEELVKRRLTEVGFESHGSTSDQELRVLFVPRVGNAMCDELAGTATDMSCRAITELEARLEGPDPLRKGVDLPSRIRNRCSSDRLMPIEAFSAFVADWIVYALEGRAKGERRPVARC